MRQKALSRHNWRMLMNQLIILKTGKLKESINLPLIYELYYQVTTTSRNFNY